MEPGLTQNLPDPALIVKDLNIDVGRPKLADRGRLPSCTARPAQIDPIQPRSAFPRQLLELSDLVIPFVYFTSIVILHYRFQSVEPFPRNISEITDVFHARPISLRPSSLPV